MCINVEFRMNVISFFRDMAKLVLLIPVRNRRLEIIIKGKLDLRLFLVEMAVNKMEKYIRKRLHLIIHYLHTFVLNLWTNDNMHASTYALCKQVYFKEPVILNIALTSWADYLKCGQLARPNMVSYKHA